MYAGGKLYRVVNDSLFRMVEDSLTSLDWFAAGRGHAPITLLPQPLDEDESLTPTTITFSMDDITNADAEMGSILSEHRVMYFIDVYGETKTLALHIAADIKDILEGRFPSIGRGESHFEVMDFAQASPYTLFYCEIEEVEVDRNRVSSRPFEKYWWTISFDLVFTYSDENSGY